MSTVSTSELEIVHSPENSKFYCVIDNADVNAELLYSLDGNAIDFYRTFVPPEARGGKVAFRLVERGISWAEEQNYNISASCWYVQKYLDRRARDNSNQ